jgi:hypothetical protein
MARRKIADKIPQRTFVIAAAPGESIWLGQTLLLSAEVACLRTMRMSREGLSFRQNIPLPPGRALVLEEFRWRWVFQQNQPPMPPSMAGASVPR